jgi:hypothetical protein
MNDLLPYAISVVVLIILAAVTGRMVSQRRLTASTAGLPPLPAVQPGEDRCLLRAEFNYTNDSPAISRVTITYYNGDKQRYEVMSNAMTQSDFNKYRTKLRLEGWREEGMNSDKEGESYYFRR